MAISRESDNGRRVDPASERETDVPPNLFSKFVAEHSQQFLEYRSYVRELRLTDRAWRLAFQPSLQVFFDGAEMIPGMNSKKINKLLTESAQVAFKIWPADYEDPGDDSPQEPNDKSNQGLHLAGIVREWKTFGIGQMGLVSKALGSMQSDSVGLLIEWDRAADSYNTDFNRAISAPMGNLRKVKKDLTDKAWEYFLSDYNAMTDTLIFLSDPRRGKEKDAITAFFKDFVAEDSEARRTRTGSGFTAHLREEWQNRLRGSFNPVVFERFWQDAIKSGKVTEIVDWVTFGVRLAKSQRDEEAGLQLNPHDVRVAISRVPINEWPKPLRDAYLGFAQRDPANLVEEIRAKLLQNFPKVPEKSIYVGYQDNVKSPKKVKTHGIARVSDNSHENGNDQEAEKGLLSLALLKTYAASGSDSHYVIPVDVDRQDAEIARLCSVGKTAQMKADLVRVIEVIRNPMIAYGPTVHKLKDITVTIDKTKQQLRRVDPKKLRNISFEDPETNRARVVFAIFDDVLAIAGVYATHEDYEKAVLTTKTS